jgi:hypothetical protein
MKIKTKIYKPRNAQDGYQKPGEGHEPASPSQPPEETKLTNTSSQTSGHQNCETLSFCCLSQLVHGTLLWQPQGINRNNGILLLFFFTSGSHNWCRIGFQ